MMTDMKLHSKASSRRTSHLHINRNHVLLGLKIGKNHMPNVNQILSVADRDRFLSEAVQRASQIEYASQKELIFFVIGVLQSRNFDRTQIEDQHITDAVKFAPNMTDRQRSTVLSVLHASFDEVAVPPSYISSSV